jgi:glycerol-3-phosphate dehydrogenase
LAGTTTALALGTYYSIRPGYLYAEAPSDIPVTKRRPGPLWSPPSRQQMIDHLKTSGLFMTRTPQGGPEPSPVPKDAPRGKAIGEYGSSDDEDVFDLLIVGGGATGAGTALDAASRGLKVACVERDDFSSGTSSKSTKLVHGGVRYLQKAIMELDRGEFRFAHGAEVQECRLMDQNNGTWSRKHCANGASSSRLHHIFLACSRMSSVPAHSHTRRRIVKNG